MTEEEYVAYLAGERRRYAWVMRTHGGMPAGRAAHEAMDCYPYEPPEAAYRTLVFHDEAWHWAMLALHGGDYVHRPGLVCPPEEYEALD
ncbi:hypothetical protein NPS70_01000 [Streptomyces sp. C10-9-1]|uniref:hypothetical protein n=1 Tax=Streptomyces sp. C10-9-1 TaxID=1859285 RepID=UPI0021124367|nr:hypothetical protein [Streptomyces sp. C10-9-1]MCQ6551783.1 hypothetical protein [Streptomyces sp. C10-9-1]